MFVISPNINSIDVAVESHDEQVVLNDLRYKLKIKIDFKISNFAMHLCDVVLKVLPF